MYSLNNLNLKRDFLETEVQNEEKEFYTKNLLTKDKLKVSGRRL